MNNQIFGYQKLPNDSPQTSNSFEGAQEILAKTADKLTSPQLRFFSTPHTSLQSRYVKDHKTFVYVWGIPSHPEIDIKDIPEWCVKIVSSKNYDRFKELIGTFVIIIDEPDHRRLTFVTDILGIRPIFVGTYGDRIVFGSRVWPLYKAGLSTGAIDYDSVSSWVAYKYNLTEGSLFSDLHRLPPGTVTVFEGNRSTGTPYAEFHSGSDAPSIERAAEDIHGMVTSTIKCLLAHQEKVLIALSGGLDSRYILALTLQLGRTAVECASVGFTAEEEHVAGLVAQSLGIPLKSYPVNGSTWDLYDDVYHFMPDGFPISKMVTFLLAQDYSGIPMVNGFMGDALIRGDSDTYQDKYETEWKEDLVDVLQRKHTKITPRIFSKDFAARLKDRSRPPMERAVREGTRLGKVFGWQDYYYTHRFYISNNFIQHIDLSEAILPFYSWPLLSYKMEHDYKVFIPETYKTIYRNKFPELAEIAWAKDLAPKKPEPGTMSSCSKQWAQKIMLDICKKDYLSLLQKRLCIPINIAGIAGVRKVEFALHDIYRYYLIENKLKESGLNFDWDRI